MARGGFLFAWILWTIESEYCQRCENCNTLAQGRRGGLVGGKIALGLKPERFLQTLLSCLQLWFKYFHFNYAEYFLAKKQGFKKREVNSFFGGPSFLVLWLAIL